MASSFPPRDGVPPPQIPSNPPNHSFFNEEAIWSTFNVLDESRHADVQRHDVDVTESLEREIIKQRIRAEIMAEELARRRILEEEIRIELMLEREMAMRRMESTGSRFDSYPRTSQFLHESSIIPHSPGYPGDRRLALPSTMPVYREVGFSGFQPLPFQRDPLAAPSEPRKETVLLYAPHQQPWSNPNDGVLGAPPANQGEAHFTQGPPREHTLAAQFDALAIRTPGPEWYFDTGATSHMAQGSGPSDPARDSSVQ